MIPSVVISAIFVFCLSSPGEVQYAAGHKAEIAKAHGTAVQAFQSCEKEDDTLRYYAELRLTRNAFRGAPATEAIRAYQALLERLPEGPWRRMASAELAELLYKNKAYGAAAEAFDRLLAADHHPWWMQRYFSLSAENLISSAT
ncbi:MAG: hypothetical protein IH628_16765, partial [Proteobacteria bacterium]|nr:hypothetical protein [Pseudomonadota bacterium]